MESAPCRAGAVGMSTDPSGPSDATAASEDTPPNGIFAAYEIPFAVARPIRKPVKEPGPRPIAIPFNSESVIPCREINSRIAPGNISLCFFGGPLVKCSITWIAPLEERTTNPSESVNVEVSMERSTPRSLQLLAHDVVLEHHHHQHDQHCQPDHVRDLSRPSGNGAAADGFPNRREELKAVQHGNRKEIDQSQIDRDHRHRVQIAADPFFRALRSDLVEHDRPTHALGRHSTRH